MGASIAVSGGLLLDGVDKGGDRASLVSHPTPQLKHSDNERLGIGGEGIRINLERQR